jgi:hypothetical protein
MDGGMMRRWTDGDASLSMGVAEPSVLEFMVAGTLDYPLRQASGAALIRKRAAAA